MAARVYLVQRLYRADFHESGCDTHEEYVAFVAYSEIRAALANTVTRVAR